MSPEQARGEDATTASDVFSLGATLLYAATGAGPFGSGEPRLLLLRAAAGKTEKAPKTLPPDLRRRIEAMTAKDPANRPSAAAARGGTDGGVDGPGTHPRTIAQRALRPGRTRTRTIAGAVVIALLVAAAAVAIVTGADDNGGRLSRSSSTTAAGSKATTTTEACTPLAYQPCGEDPAPNTDGTRCLPGFADYDDDKANGCEAQADDLDTDAPLQGSLVANLVPGDDSDTYLLQVSDQFQFDCGGEVHVTLTAPAGLSQRVTVLRGTKELGTAVSGDGEPATVTIGDPNCGSDDGEVLRVRVESVGSDRSPSNYSLKATGSY